jgi:hypothetical protein
MPAASRSNAAAVSAPIASAGIARGELASSVNAGPGARIASAPAGVATRHAASRGPSSRARRLNERKKAAESTEAPSASAAAGSRTRWLPDPPTSSAVPASTRPIRAAVERPVASPQIAQEASATHTGATNTSRTTGAAGAPASAWNSSRPAPANATPPAPASRRCRASTSADGRRIAAAAVRAADAMQRRAASKVSGRAPAW